MSVMTESHSVDLIVVSLQNMQQPPVFYIPDADRSVGRTAGDKTYVGQASARMWAAYRGMCELDARPSRSGRLEPGEIVRVVVSDLKQVPKFIEIASSFPQNVKTVLNGMSECCFSLFLAEISQSEKSAAPYCATGGKKLE